MCNQRLQINKVGDASLIVAQGDGMAASIYD